MNVIQRICEKYPIEYTMMPDFRMQSVSLTFGAKVPYDLQDKILEGLDWLNVFVEDMGIPMTLDICTERADSYTLTSGQNTFHFSPYPSIPLVNYDLTEAVTWTIYILAGRKHWLDAYRGRYISCRCFSAQQQTAAMQISSSVARQYQSGFPEEHLSFMFEKLRACVTPFVARAPRFSAQPIEESVFEKCKGRPAEASLQEIADRLFGQTSFEQESQAYCRLVQNSNVYRSCLENAVCQLMETAYTLPIMAVSPLFTQMSTLIDEIELADSSVYRKLLQEQVKFTLSAAYLKKCFEQLDSAYLHTVRTELETTFLREVCEKAHTRINHEFTSARRSITQLRNALSRFCFVRPGSFEKGGVTGDLTWKQLADLAERDVSSKTTSWTPDAFNSIQSELKSLYAPQLWICSEKLRNQSELASITDIHLTKPAPIMDERLIWAIWVDV